MFKNPFSFEGRIRRIEYALSILSCIILFYVITIMVNRYTENQETIIIVLGLSYIPLLWFVFAQGAKRCHDKGKNGWYQFIPFYIFWLLFADGDPGRNQYADNPKGLGNLNKINAN